MKSNAINSIDLVGFKKILAYSVFLSIKSSVVVVLSNTSLYSTRQKRDLTVSSIGITTEVNLAQVSSTIG